MAQFLFVQTFVLSTALRCARLNDMRIVSSMKVTDERFRVVFISPRNSLRSVIAEACLLHLAKQRFIATSCGQPGRLDRAIHPAAIGALSSASIEIPAGSPKSWDALIRSGAPIADFVITLDDEVASFAPRWPGQPEVATWSFPDIAGGAGAEEMGISAIRMLHLLRRRLELLINLPLAGPDRHAIRSDVRDLAHLY